MNVESNTHVSEKGQKQSEVKKQETERSVGIIGGNELNKIWYITVEMDR